MINSLSNPPKTICLLPFDKKYELLRLIPSQESTKNKHGLIEFLETLKTLLKKNFFYLYSTTTFIEINTRTYLVNKAKKLILNDLKSNRLKEGNKILRLWKSIQALHSVSKLSLIPNELQFLIFSNLKEEDLEAVSQTSIYLKESVRGFYAYKANLLGYSNHFLKLQHLISRVFCNKHTVYLNNIFRELPFFFENNKDILKPYFQYDKNRRIHYENSLIFLRKKISPLHILELLKKTSNYHYDYNYTITLIVDLLVINDHAQTYTYKEQQQLLLKFWQAFVTALFYTPGLSQSQHIFNTLISYKQTKLNPYINLQDLEKASNLCFFKEIWLVLKHLDERLNTFVASSHLYLKLGLTFFDRVHEKRFFSGIVHWNEKQLLEAPFFNQLSKIKYTIPLPLPIKILLLTIFNGNHKGTFLHEAVITNNLNLMNEFISFFQGNVNIKNRYSETPLHLASRSNNLAALNILIHANANPDVTDNMNQTPLHIACDHFNPEIVKALLCAGANPSSQDLWGQTPLHRACKTRNIEVVKLLIRATANLYILNSWKQTPLHIACEKGHVKIIRALIEAGASTSVQDNKNTTPLEYAKNHIHFKIEITKNSVLIIEL